MKGVGERGLNQFGRGAHPFRLLEQREPFTKIAVRDTFKAKLRQPRRIVPESLFVLGRLAENGEDSNGSENESKRNHCLTSEVQLQRELHDPCVLRGKDLA